jgi:hypothetical protein
VPRAGPEECAVFLELKLVKILMFKQQDVSRM